VCSEKEEENVIQRNFLRNTEPVLCAVRKWLWNAGRCACWSTKVKGEPVLCAVRKWLWNAGR